MLRDSHFSRISNKPQAEIRIRPQSRRFACQNHQRSNTALSTLSVLMLAVALAVCAAHVHVIPAHAQQVPPVDGACCGKKPPKFKDLPATATLPAQTYSSFTGQIAIVTGQLVGGTSVVVIDLKNQNAGVPVDKNWNSTSTPPNQLYRHPDWAQFKIGDVFGLTLDNPGNVYVTATTSYLYDYSLAGVTRGEVYRIDGSSGTVSKFVTLPNGTITGGAITRGPGLGNINYSCKHDNFYVSNFADGRIYRMVSSTATVPTGIVKSTFDHQSGVIAASVSANGDPEPGRDYTEFVPKNHATPGDTNWGRVWGLAVYGDRLYYGVWRQDTLQYAGVNNTPNEVWSVQLVSTGANRGEFVAGTKQLEIRLPTLQSHNPTSITGIKNYSNPVASISFKSTGEMLLAERSMNGDSNHGSNPNIPAIAAHESRLLEYSRPNAASAWTTLTTATANKFGVGAAHPYTNPTVNSIEGNRPGCAGGGDYDCVGRRVWATGDALHYMGTGQQAGGFPYPPDVGPPQTDYIYGLQGLPMSGGTIHNSLLIDLTNSTASKGNKNEIGDVEIPCAECDATPTPTPAECCDKLTAVPHPQENLSLDFRTFTITNLKAPVSPICSVDINLSPAPPYKQGGDLYIDGSLVPTGTRFISPYNRIPNAGATTISAVNTVRFNIGIDYTLVPPWTGTITFIVNHCDGTKCTLTYGPWTATKPTTTTTSTDVFDVSVLTHGKLYALSLQLKGRERRRPIKWISFMVADSKGQLFAGSGPSVTGSRARPSAQFSVEESELSRTAVLYAFAQPLRSREAAGPFELILKPDANAADAPKVIWTTYDANGNTIETGTIASPRGTLNQPR